jgi:hypothetical protein
MARFWLIFLCLLLAAVDPSPFFWGSHFSPPQINYDEFVKAMLQ